MPKKRVTQSPKVVPTEAAICARVRELRVKKGLTLAELAKLTECSVDTLKSYEYARVPIRYGFARRFCRELKVSQEWLATGQSSCPHDIKIGEELEDQITGRLLFSEVYSKILKEAIATVFSHWKSFPQFVENVDFSPYLDSMREGLYLGLSSICNALLERQRRDELSISRDLPPALLGEFFERINSDILEFRERYKDEIQEWKGEGPRGRSQFYNDEGDRFEKYAHFKLGWILEPPAQEIDLVKRVTPGTLASLEAYRRTTSGAIMLDTAKKDLQNYTACRSSDGVYEKHPENMQTEINHNIAPRLISARKKSGLTQSEAAKKWGFSIGTLRDWEQDRRKPTGLYKERLEKILSEIGVE